MRYWEIYLGTEKSLNGSSELYAVSPEQYPCKKLPGIICGPHVMSGGFVVFVIRTSFDSVGQSVMSWLLSIYKYLCK